MTPIFNQNSFANMTYKELALESHNRRKLLEMATYATAAVITIVTVFFLTRLVIKRIDDHAKVSAHRVDEQRPLNNDQKRNTAKKTAVEPVADIVDMSSRAVVDIK